MRTLLVSLFVFLVTVVSAEEAQRVIVVVGAAGTPEYGEQFRVWADRWRAAAEKGRAECTIIGLDETADDREQLKSKLTGAAANSKSALWLVLIGHGTFDGKTARFNLRGPDVSPTDLNEWLKGIEQPVAIVNCTSCSGPFLAELSAANRAIVTATRSGSEVNFARLGDYLSATITDGSADLDKDEQVSLLEAYLVAAAKAREFYASESRLATEHALLDDNADRLGTPAEWFRGIRPTKAAKDGAALDGSLANRFVLVRSEREETLSAELRTQRDALEGELAKLRRRQGEMKEDDYLATLESLLVKIARLYEPAAPMQSK